MQPARHGKTASCLFPPFLLLQNYAQNSKKDLVIETKIVQNMEWRVIWSFLLINVVRNHCFQNS